MAQGSVIVRELIASLGFELDEDELDEWDARITEVTQNVGAAVAGMGTAVVGAVAAVTQRLISMGDDLGDVATRTGVSAQELAEWDHVAQLSGTSAEAVRGVLARLPGVMDRVAGGNRAMRETFASLGVEVFDAEGGMRATGDVLQDLVGGLARIENPTARAAMATRVFGRRGAELAGLFEQGSDGVSRLRGEVRDLYGDDLPGFVQAASRAQDAEDRLGMQMTALGVVIGSELLPTVAGLLEGAVEGGRAFVTWARETNVVRPALIALTAVILSAAAAATVLALTTVEVWGPPALAIAAVALAAAALGFAIDDVLTMLEGGDSILGRMLGDEGPEVIRIFNEMISLIREDLAALSGNADFGWMDLMRGGLEVLVSTVAALMMMVLIATRMITFSARSLREYGEAVHEWVAGAWQAAAQRIAEFVSGALAGISRVQGAMSSLAGFLGISVSGQASTSVDGQTQRVAMSPSNRTTTSSKSISVGQIVVEGVSDPSAAAEEVRGNILRLFADESDSAREDLVPEAA